MPPFPASAFFGIPLAGALLFFGVCSRLLAVETIDEKTGVNLFVVIAAAAVLFVFVWKVSREWANCQNELKNTRSRIRAQGDLIKFLYNQLPEIHEKEGRAKQLLAALDGEESKERSSR